MRDKATRTTALVLLCLGLLGSGGTSKEDERVARAHSLLQAQLGGNVEIETESVATVTWPNSALGCPKPDMMYAQVLMEGYRIVLVAEGRRYVFHGASNGEPFYCENPQLPLNMR